MRQKVLSNFKNSKNLDLEEGGQKQKNIQITKKNVIMPKKKIENIQSKI